LPRKVECQGIGKRQQATSNKQQATRQKGSSIEKIKSVQEEKERKGKAKGKGKGKQKGSKKVEKEQVE